MHSRKTTSRLGAVVATGMMVLAGCASGGKETTSGASPGSAASPTAAAAGATVSGSLELLDGHPAGYDELSGSATLNIGDEGTEGTIFLTGLNPETSYVAHVHQQACDMEKGGPHFKFDAAGSDMPPNEIHWNFTSDSEGSVEATTSNERAVPKPTDRSIVVHEKPGSGSGGADGMDSESVDGNMSGDMSGEMEDSGRHQPIACADLS